MQVTSKRLFSNMNPLTMANPLSEERERELLKGASSYTYKTGESLELSAHCFFPEDHNPAELKPAIIFFHGGLWDISIITQFVTHCMHFASRGMVAITVEYRVSSKHNTTPEDSLSDAQTAMLWAKQNHQVLGIDPDKIILAGAAAGANMALSMAMIPEVMVIENYSARPMAVIGLSAIVDTTKKGNEFERFADPAVAVKNSPSKNIKKRLVPSLFIHGQADTVIPHSHLEKFVKAMKGKKNNCELISLGSANHSFFNFNVNPKHFELTLNAMDSFVADLGCIEPVEYS